MSESNDNKQKVPLEVVVESKDNTKKNEKVHEVQTKYGKMRVSVQGTINSRDPIIFTYHDIGMNHSFFSKFLDMVSHTESSLNGLTFVHLEAPGQNPDAEDLGDEIKYFDFAELAEMVELVRKELNVSHFYSFGVGAGAYVLLEYAIKYGRHVLGQILVSPTSKKCGWGDWFNRLKSSVFDKQWTEMFVNRWTSPYTRKYKTDLVQELIEMLHHTNHNNLAKFMAGFEAREDIGKQLETVEIETLFIAGENSSTFEDCLDVMSHYPKTKFSWVKVHNAAVASLLESGTQVLQPINLFLSRFGILNWQRIQKKDKEVQKKIGK